MKKLSELVQSALNDASTKVASSAPVPETEKQASANPMADLVRKGRENDAKRNAAVGIDDPMSAKRASVTETAKLAMQFAESIEHLATVFPKLAAPMAQATGPEAMESPTKGTTKDTNTKATTLSAAEASHGGGGGNAKGQVANDGSVGGVPDRFSKKAAEEILLAKIAQSEALMSIGRANEAATLAKAAQEEFEKASSRFDSVAKAVGEKARSAAFGSGQGAKAMVEPGVITRGARKVVDKAQEIGRKGLGGTDINSDTGRGLMAMGGAAAGVGAAGAAGAKALHDRSKKAYEEEDGSTRTPKGNPKSLETYVSGTSGAPGGVAPDNARAASMTQRDAKKREIPQLAQHVREPALSARSDRGIQDNFEHTQGAKIASKLDAIAARKAATA